jgi:small conductance mechanosensitive channel
VSRQAHRDGDSRLERLLETRSHNWEAVGLAAEVRRREARRARTRAAVLVPLVAAVIVAYALRARLFGVAADTPVRILAVISVVTLGWAIARDIGRAVAPRFYRRLDPATAGTIGFLIRLATIGVTLLVALQIAQVSPATLVAGGAFTAVVVGLAAQQTLGNLFAGLVLVSVRPFRVGERVRLQAGALAGQAEGVVSSLGLLYTTFAQGEDRIMVPNTAVLSAAVVPVREPESVDIRVRLGPGTRPTQVQAILDARITTPIRDAATVLLQELDDEGLIVRVLATPAKAADGGKLADEVVAALTAVMD